MSFFKDCDIRAKIGNADNELNGEKAFLLGKTIGTIITSKNYNYSNEIVIGGDIRLSTKVLKKELINGLLESGGKVVDVSICSTPFFYYAIDKLGIDNGIMVTASHNPKEFNGFKFVLGPIPVLKKDLEQIESVYNSGRFVKKAGSIKRIDLKSQYINFLKSFYNFKYNDKAVIDFSNGCNILYFKEIADNYFSNIFYINDKLDGNFPGHVPNPAISENLSQLSGEVKRMGADIGVCFDSDGDRVTFVDEKGEMVDNDKMLIIIASYIIKNMSKYTEEKVVCETKSSIIIKEMMMKIGAYVITEKTGHTYIKKRVVEEDAICGGEITGHYFYRMLGGRDDGIISTLLVLKILIEENKSIFKLASEIKSYYITEDIRIPFDNEIRRDMFNKIKTDVIRKNLNVDLKDGIKVFMLDNSWALVRVSISEPLFSLRFEVKEKNKQSEIIDIFLESVPALKNRVKSKLGLCK